jgi:GTPase SAR1 family protein
MAGRTTVKAKVVLLGEGAVGKTSLVLRYVDNKFNDKHVQTLQVGDGQAEWSQSHKHEWRLARDHYHSYAWNLSKQPTVANF